MHDDGQFDATIAATYDDPLDPMNQPATIEPAVAFLAALAETVRERQAHLGLGEGHLGLSDADDERLGRVRFTLELE
jgi:hypothetical protein